VRGLKRRPRALAIALANARAILLPSFVSEVMFPLAARFFAFLGPSTPAYGEIKMQNSYESWSLSIFKFETVIHSISTVKI